MTTDRRRGGVGGTVERRRRELSERLAVEEAAGAPPAQVQQTRRQLRDAERAATAARAEREARRAAEAAQARRQAHEAREAVQADRLAEHLRARRQRPDDDRQLRTQASLEPVTADADDEHLAVSGPRAPAGRSRPRPVVRPPTGARMRGSSRAAPGSTSGGTEPRVGGRPPFVATAPELGRPLPAQPATRRRSWWWWAAIVVALAVVAVALLWFVDRSDGDTDQRGAGGVVLSADFAAEAPTPS